VSDLYIRAPNWVGDLTMATPVLAAAAEDARWDRVHVGLRAHLAPLLSDAPFSIRVHGLASAGAELALLRELRPDAALLLSSSFRCAWLAWRVRVPVRAGAAVAGRRPLLTHSLLPATLHGRRIPTPTAHLLRDVAGLVGVSVPDLHPRLGLSDDGRRRIRQRLEALGVAGDYVLACPGAAFGSAKLWPPTRFAEVLDALAKDRGLGVVITGAPSEAALVRAVGGACKSKVATVEVDLVELRALVAGAALLLVGDSGPRWIAAAFDVPCVSVMGPNFPEQTASSLERATVVRRNDLECAPCLQRRCPLGHQRCMTELEVAPVVAAAERLLG
jgi:lipopolysaccharide heptosyltransferase II